MQPQALQARAPAAARLAAGGKAELASCRVRYTHRCRLPDPFAPAAIALPPFLQSYHRFMREHLFDHVDIPPEAVHVPDGTVPLAEVPR